MSERWYVVWGCGGVAWGDEGDGDQSKGACP